MDIQILIVLLIVAAAVVFIGRKVWKSVVTMRNAKNGCGGSCCH